MIIMRSDTHRGIASVNTGYLVENYHRHYHHNCLLRICYVQTILHPLHLKFKQILERSKVGIIITILKKIMENFLFSIYNFVFQGGHRDALCSASILIYLSMKVWNENRRANFSA